MSSVAATLAKFYGCLFVYESEFWFHHFTSASNTGSSIMPHKKNRMFWIDSWKMQQDSSFAIRNHFNNHNLPSGYHRDLQLLKEGLFPATTWKLSRHRYFLHQRHQSEEQYPSW
jgi:argininosuccinate lyase